MLRKAGYSIVFVVVTAAIVVTQNPETQNTVPLEQVYHAYYVSADQMNSLQVSQVKNPTGRGLKVSFGGFNGKGNNKGGSSSNQKKKPITFPKPPSTLKPSTFKPSTFKPSTFKPSTLKPSTFKPSTLKPSTFKPSTLKPSTLKPATLKPSTLKPMTFKPSTFKPQTLKPVTLKPQTLKPVTIKPTGIATFKPQTLKPVTLKPNTLKPITIKPTGIATFKPVTLKPVTFKPITLKPVTFKPITLKPIGIVTLKPITIKRPPIFPCPPVTCWLPGCRPNVVVVPGGGSEVVVVESTPVPVAEKLMQLRENDIVSFGGNQLGEQAGQIQLRYGEVAVTPELKDWQNDRFTMKVPEMGLQDGAVFEMFVIDATGEVNNAMRVEIVPGEPAEEAMPEASVMEGDVASLGGELGEEPGKVELRIGELRLAMEINEWTSQYSNFMVPTLGLAKPVAAQMVLINAAGQEVQAVDVSIIPAADNVAADN